MSGKVQTIYDQLTYQIIGCAMEVNRSLGPGYREDTYQRAMELHLSKKGLSHEPQKLLGVYDTGQGNVLLGYYIPDFIVDNRVVVEIKALRGLDASHVAQVIGYLAVFNAPLGLLLNFGRRSLEWRRVLPPSTITEHTINRQWLFVPEWLRERA